MSTYRYILGIPSFANHDQAACLLRVAQDGSFEYVAISEERLSREKHSYRFPLLAIDYCLRRFGLERVSQVDVLATDYIRLNRWKISGPTYNIGEYDYLKEKMDFDTRKIVSVNHHLAHAASTFFFSPFDQAAILVIDGNGSEVETQSFYQGDKNAIKLVDKSHFHGIGHIYASVTDSIVNFGLGGEGKTMGLAPYGEGHPPVMDFRRKTDGIHTDYSDLLRRQPLSDVMNQMDPANVREPFLDPWRKRAKDEDPLDPYFARVAWELQNECEEVMVHLAGELHRRCPSKNLCVSGGVMLNCVGNRHILERTPFEHISMFPGCGDEGVAVGACLQVLYTHELFKDMPKKRQVLANAYMGRPYSDDEVAETLERYSIPSTTVDAKGVAELLADRKVVAWFQGGSEFGPRALGHRSIMADSRDPEIKDRVNAEVKHREGFRPFAPVVPQDKCATQFDLDHPSPFMLLVGDALRPEEIPSVIHVDDSARIQTTTAEDNGAYHQVIEEFGEITGIPVLMNTSFNVAGEPIVETPRDALICALGTDMDYLVLHDRLVECRFQGRDKALEAMKADRGMEIETWRERVIRDNFPGYDRDEMDAFIRRGNEMSLWWAKHRAKYELENKVMEWKGKSARIGILGEARHTRYLIEYINGFCDLNVVGFAPHDTAEGVDYPVMTREELLAAGPDVLLLSSWERQFTWQRELKPVWKGETYLVYDRVGRSLEDLYPEPEGL